MKKAMEVNPLAVVVATVLLLIVLVVLIFGFSKSSGGFFGFLGELGNSLWGNDDNEVTCDNPYLGRTSDPSEATGCRTIDPPSGKNWDESPCYQC